MRARSLKIWPLFLLVGAALIAQTTLCAQDVSPADALPPVPQGVEVLARGPVHEAFASLTAEPQPTKLVPKKPSKPLDEMPPEVKPAGDVLWIGGYWAWDEERKDFLWVSGIWRTPPPDKQWVAGYWREQGDDWQWVPGFWTPVAKQDAPQEVTYMPKPPDPPALAAPGAPPSADTFYVPGHWEWNGAVYLWRGGYWARVQPNYVWIAAHYRWTPGGYIYIAGYWDYSVKRRGVLFAPVVIDPLVVNESFVYTPAYAVQDTLVVDALFVRPATCSYYFGDYYDVSYRDAGYTSCVVYSRTNYDSIIVYERYQHREEPNWINVQVDLCNDRFAGRAPVPPRTLIQQTTIVQNNITVNNNTNINNSTTNITNNTNNVTVNRNVMKTAVLAPPAQVMAAQGVQSVKLDTATRAAAQQQSAAVQQVAVQRGKNEIAAPGGAPKQPRVASFTVPPVQAVAPKSLPAAAANGNRPAVASPGFSRPAVAPSVATAPTKTPVAPAVTAAPKGPTLPPATTQTTPLAPPVKPITPATPPLTTKVPPASQPPLTIKSPPPAPPASQPPPTTKLLPPAPPASQPLLTTKSPPPPPPASQPLLRPSAPPAMRPAPPPPTKRPPPKDKDKDQH